MLHLKRLHHLRPQPAAARIFFAIQGIKTMAKTSRKTLVSKARVPTVRSYVWAIITDGIEYQPKQAATSADVPAETLSSRPTATAPPSTAPTPPKRGTNSALLGNSLILSFKSPPWPNSKPTAKSSTARAAVVSVFSPAACSACRKKSAAEYSRC